MESFADLERLQTRILQRITNLELSLLPTGDTPLSAASTAVADDTTTVDCLSSILLGNGVRDFCFKRVASDYYDWPLEARRDVLGAASVHHLCKSIVLVPPTYLHFHVLRQAFGINFVIVLGLIQSLKLVCKFC